MGRQGRRTRWINSCFAFDRHNEVGMDRPAIDSHRYHGGDAMPAIYHDRLQRGLISRIPFWHLQMPSRHVRHPASQRLKHSFTKHRNAGASQPPTLYIPNTVQHIHS